MKILQNPIAVIALSVVAVALIAGQIAWPMIQRSHWMQHAPPAASPAVPAPKSATKPQPAMTTLAPAEAINVMPDTKIDASAARASAARSAESPQRDPFAGRLLTTNQATAYPPAGELLTFNGFWRQTGSTLAVINNQVIAVGDSILAFKVESIDHDRVWVVGPNGRETVEFGASHVTPRSGPASGAPTNSAAPARPDN